MIVRPCRLVAESRCACGESPVWHAEERALYWADLPAGRLFRYRPADDRHELVREGDELGAITLQGDGGLLLMGAAGRVSSWKGGRETAGPERLPGETRFNDAIADAAGRIYAGTMPTTWATTDPAEMGALYRLDPDGRIEKIGEGFRGANGLAFSQDGRHLLMIDSPTQKVWHYPYDPRTGELKPRKIWLDTSDEDHPGCPSFPDGMARDRDGGLWVARWGGYGVTRYDTAGQKIGHFAVPTSATTSVAFGGPGLSTLYVTSARPHGTPEDDTQAGGLFAIELRGVCGVPEYRSRFPVSVGP